MKFDVTRRGEYEEFSVFDDKEKISTGLMDREETISLMQLLLLSVELLMPPDLTEEEYSVQKVRESLYKK